MRHHSTPIRMTTIKKNKTQEIKSVGEDMQKLKFFCTADGKIKLFNCKIVWWFLKKLRTTIWSNDFTYRYIHPKNWKQGLEEIFAHPYSQQHYSQQLQIEATQVSIGGWMNKMWYMHIMKCYSVLKGKDLWHVDELWRHYSKWNKPITHTKKQILYDSTYRKYLE